jgi:hypothetical protein
MQDRENTMENVTLRKGLRVDHHKQWSVAIRILEEDDDGQNDNRSRYVWSVYEKHHYEQSSCHSIEDYRCSKRETPIFT